MRHSEIRKQLKELGISSAIVTDETIEGNNAVLLRKNGIEEHFFGFEQADMDDCANQMQDYGEYLKETFA